MNDVGWYIISGFDGIMIKWKDSLVDNFGIDWDYILKDSIVVLNWGNDNFNFKFWRNIGIGVLIVVVMVVIVWGLIKFYYKFKMSSNVIN